MTSAASTSSRLVSAGSLRNGFECSQPRCVSSSVSGYARSASFVSTPARVVQNRLRGGDGRGGPTRSADAEALGADGHERDQQGDEEPQLPVAPRDGVVVVDER